jgi:phage shock protein A
MSEVDRARQAVREAAKEHELQLKTLRSHVDHLQAECENVRRQLGESRGQYKAADAVREHLEARLRQLQAAPSRKGSRPRASKRVRRSAKAARAR